MQESEFHREADAILARVEAAAEAGGDVEADLEGGVLTLGCPDGTRIIVNRQAPAREIWVAARSGGFHFRHDGAGWRDTRSGEALFAALSRLAAAQGGGTLDFG